MVDQEVRDRNSRGGAGGEVKERDQGDKGPNNRARSKSSSPVLLQWTKEARRKASSNSSSRARARDREKPPCYLCQGPHYVKDCPNMKAATEALKKAQSKN